MRTDAVALLMIGALLTASPVYAYVDPGTGGMLVQFVAGGLAGLLVLVRLFWLRILAALRKDKGAPHGPEAGPRAGR